MALILVYPARTGPKTVVRPIQAAAGIQRGHWDKMFLSCQSGAESQSAVSAFVRTRFPVPNQASRSVGARHVECVRPVFRSVTPQVPPGSHFRDRVSGPDAEKTTGLAAERRLRRGFAAPQVSDTKWTDCLTIWTRDARRRPTTRGFARPWR